MTSLEMKAIWLAIRIEILCQLDRIKWQIALEKGYVLRTYNCNIGWVMKKI